MTRHTIPISDDLYDYLLSISLREPEILRQLRQETAELPNAGMQLAPEQGQLLRLLIQLMGAKRGIEVGVFTGYSSLCAALAMPADGLLIACDVSEKYTKIARRYWGKAGVAHKIDLRLAPAIETLQRLLAQDGAESFDYAFIDADKSNYMAYYEACLKLLRPGGLAVVDNVLWHGQVLDAADQSADTVAIRALNRHLHQDQRVEALLLPIGDGLYLARKR